MVPLADIFNHKASVVMLGDGWGVAELDDLNKPQHQPNGECHDDSSSDPDESLSKASASAEEDLSPPSSTSVTDGVEESHHETEREDATSSEVPSEQWQDGGEEEAQHGFPVSGMPVLAAKPCNVATGSSAGVSGEVSCPSGSKAACAVGSLLTDFMRKSIWWEYSLVDYSQPG